MRRKVSKLLSMMLAAVMVLSMAVTGLAAEIDPLSSSTDETFSITVTNAADGETYSAYKIFDVTYSDEYEVVGDDESYEHVNYTYTIEADSPWYSVVADATDVFTLTLASNGTTYTVAIASEDVTDDEIIAVFTDAVTVAYEEDSDGTVKKVLYIDGTEVEPDASTVAADGKAYIDLTEAGPGYYFVTTTLGSLVGIDTTDPDAEIEEKNGIPTISKWVHENTAEDGVYGHEDDASNADLILFELEVDNINGAANLVIHDSMDDELEIPDETDFHMASVTLYLTSPESNDYDEDTDKITLTEDTDYTVSVGECTVEGCPLTNCAFEINFSKYDFSKVDSTGYIEITYELLLDTEGDSYADDYEEIQNQAVLTYAAASFSSIVYAETYSFGFEVFKYTVDLVYNDDDGSLVNGNVPLAGAEFEVRSATTDDNGTVIPGTQTAYFLEEDVSGKTIYLFEGWADSADDVPYGYTTTVVSSERGYVYIEGLDTGSYILEETKAPDGFNLLTNYVTVTIWAEYDDETGALTNNGVTYTYGGTDGEGVVRIENNSGSTLPSTGGMGTTIFYIVGIVLIIGAAVLLVTKRRLDRE